MALAEIIFVTVFFLVFIALFVTGMIMAIGEAYTDPSRRAENGVFAVLFALLSALLLYILMIIWTEG